MILIGAGKGEPVARGAFVPEGVLDDGEAAEPAAGIGAEARLAVLAIIDHVDPDIGLALDDGLDRLAHHGVERAGIVRLAVLPGAQLDEKLRGPRQAADVRGDDALAALPHVKFSLTSLSDAPKRGRIAFYDVRPSQWCDAT